MKKLTYTLAGIALLVVVLIQEQVVTLTDSGSQSNGTDYSVNYAYKNQQSDLQVHGEGVVIKILPDDNDGSRHQRFILRLAHGQTLLVAHNIDLAPRINGLSKGDNIEFYGEYEWNTKGGVLHWTHLDPAGHHIDGWLKHAGKIYQ